MGAADSLLLAIPLHDAGAIARMMQARGLVDEGQRPGGDRALRCDGLDLFLRTGLALPTEGRDEPRWRALLTAMPSPEHGWCGIGLGPDLAHGAAHAHILRPFLAMAVRLAEAAGAKGMATSGARLFASLDLWSDQISGFARYGLLPVLPLIALDDDGVRQSSRGLRVLVGEEIVVDAPLLDREGRSRRLVRAIIDRYRHGQFTSGSALPGMTDGEYWHVTRADGVTRLTMSMGCGR